MHPPYIAVDVGECWCRVIPKPCHGVVAIEQGDKHLLHEVGHGLRGYACPFHSLGFFGVKDMAKQYPIYPKGGNGFGVVGGEAGGTSLSNVNLPAAEIGGGWFHGVGFIILVVSTKWSGYWLSFSTTCPSSSTVIS